MAQVGTSFEETRIETFDDFNESELSTDIGELKPFQYKGDIDNHEWLKKFWMLSKNVSESRINHYKRNMYLYKGVHWKGEVATKRAPKQVVNFIGEMLDAKVSARAKNTVAFQAVPTEYSQKAINACKGVKKMLTSRCKQIDFDKKNRQLDKIMFILGHAFFEIEWDAKAGGLNNKFKRISEMLGPKALERLKKKIGANKVFSGDVVVNTYGANRVFPEMGRERGIGADGDVDYVDIVDRVHIDELKAKYPNLAEQILPDAHDDFFWRLGEESSPSNYVVLHKFTHRVTDHLIGGKRIVWCNSCILEEEDLPYRHGQINLIEARDSEIYEEYFGRSDIEGVYGMQRFYNAIQSFQARDVSMASAPKWLIPKGSVKPSSINNSFSVMEYTGPTPPQLATFKPTPDQGFVIQDRLEDKISKGLKSFDISRGEVPKGITATSALRLIEESERSVSLDGIANRKSRIIEAYNMIANTMAQFYKPEDERTINALGDKNEYMIEDVKDTDFSKFYRVEIEKTSALADSKAGKISDIVELNQVTQTDPVFKKPEIIEILGLGLDSAFRDRATISITAARTIVDRIISGKEVQEPQKYDDLIVHRGVIIDALMESSYANNLEHETVAQLKQRAMVIEYLMDKRCQENLKFAQECSLLSDFPAFLTMQTSLSDIIRIHQQGGSFASSNQPQQTVDHIPTTNNEEQGV